MSSSFRTIVRHVDATIGNLMKVEGIAASEKEKANQFILHIQRNKHKRGITRGLLVCAGMIITIYIITLWIFDILFSLLNSI